MFIQCIRGLVSIALVTFFPSLNYCFLASELPENGQYSLMRENPVALASQYFEFIHFKYFNHERNAFCTLILLSS